MTLLLVALAGGLGAAARYLVDLVVSARQSGSVPRATVVVNASACLLLGLLTGVATGLGDPGFLLAVVGVGLLGGYSTFSTASLEAARLLLTDGPRAGLVHAAVMLATSTAAAVLGLAVGTLLVR